MDSVKAKHYLYYTRNNKIPQRIFNSESPEIYFLPLSPSPAVFQITELLYVLFKKKQQKTINYMKT